LTVLGLPDGVRACLFDLDGVLTATASVHAAAWKEVFDDFLRRRAESTGERFVPFDPVADEYVDGRPRAGGTRSLPSALTRLTFTVRWRGRRLCVDVGGTDATYTLHSGGPVELAHHGQAFTLIAGQPVTHPIPPILAGPRPQQPPGRAPLPRT
jgi:Glycosyl hydrolase family 65, C-terminal domain